MAVMLWSYAAAISAEISLDLIFHSNGYNGQSQWLLDNYQARIYIGLPLLRWVELKYREGQLLEFPSMVKWLWT